MEANDKSGDASDALDSVRTAFDCLATGPEPLTIEGRLFPGLPDRRLALDDVRRRLTGPSCHPATHDSVWAHLVLRARTRAPAWKVGAAGVALPELTSVTDELGRRIGGNRADIAGDVLQGFLVGVAAVDLSRPGIMSRLRQSASRAANDALIAAMAAPIPGGDAADVLRDAPPGTVFGPMPPALPYGHPDLVLARAVADGALTGSEARLIGATRLEDVSIQTWADAHEATASTVRRTLCRAEQRLRAYLLSSDRIPRTCRRRPSGACGGVPRCRTAHCRAPRTSARRSAEPTTPTTDDDQPGGPTCD